MSPEPVVSFDLTGVLPSGLVVLEASAGTGKTYALSTLAVRYVAEAGVPVSGLCVVSFTEAATTELRGRIRSRLVDAVAHLSRGDADGRDPLLDHLLTSCPDDHEWVKRLTRVRAAVAEFDAATICTIHGFCSRILAMAGVATMASTSQLVDRDEDVDEVVNDVVLAHLGHDPESLIRPERLVAGVRALLAMPDARLHRPDLLAPGSIGSSATKQTEQRRRSESRRAADLVELAAAEVLRRRERAGRHSFDDLLRKARAQLMHPTHGPALVRLLRERFSAVLVDEFQDTDQVQWDIFRRAFVAGDGGPAVVLVGDPKQSIYRFRSADIDAYLEARRAATSRAGLTTNWRSDRPLLQGLERLLTGQTFGSPEVAFQAVDAAPGRDQSMLSGDRDAPLTVRVVGHEPDRPLTVPDARRQVRRDVVRVVSDLLSGDIRLDGREVRPSDIAILTRSNALAATTALDLAAADIPAATSSATSVFETDAARQWHLLLRALERPQHAGSARAAALTWFLGHRLSEVASFDDAAMADLHDRLRHWGELAGRYGLLRVLQEARRLGLHERLLAQPEGERHLTDLDHIAELLHLFTGTRPSGPATLLSALEHRMARPGLDEPSRDAAARRIDRDDDAVQVLTIHRAKGLEFPIVLCPYLWTTTTSHGMPHARSDDGIRELDATWIADMPRNLAWVKPLRSKAQNEQRAEEQRLLYVALTRARHRCVVWWASPTTQRGTPAALGQFLARATGLDNPPAAIDQLASLAESSGGTLCVLPVPDGPVEAAPRRPATPGRKLSASNNERDIDDAWRIWSFSSITVAARNGDDEAPDATAVPAAGGLDESAATTPVPPTANGWDTLPAGTRFGTLVHRILEKIDFTSATLADDLSTTATDEVRRHRVDADVQVLGTALQHAIATPLGGPLGSHRLLDVGRADRLDELEFHIPLARVSTPLIGQALAQHLPAGDPVLPWAETLAAGRLTVDIDGMLTGSIDLVARVTTDHGPTRYFVADYKTNRLPVAVESSHADLTDAMWHSDYPLQATLYLVALHRLLRQRLRGYEPRLHIVGAAYLFLRGMHPDAAAPRGVFWWTPPEHALTAVDELLATGGAR